MQSQEFSEEYYKMKYFKYRAKYEQLKEIAEVRGLHQQGGNFFGFRTKTPVKQPGPGVSIVQPSSDANNVQIQKPSFVQKVQQKYTDYTVRNQEKQEKKDGNIQQLMDDIHNFVLKNLKTINERKYKLRNEEYSKSGNL